MSTHTFLLGVDNATIQPVCSPIGRIKNPNEPQLPHAPSVRMVACHEPVRVGIVRLVHGLPNGQHIVCVPHNSRRFTRSLRLPLPCVTPFSVVPCHASGMVATVIRCHAVTWLHRVPFGCRILRPVADSDAKHHSHNAKPMSTTNHTPNFACFHPHNARREITRQFHALANHGLPTSNSAARSWGRLVRGYPLRVIIAAAS